MPGAPEYAPDKPGRQQTITDPQLGQGEADPAELFEEPHHQGGCKPGHYERCLVLRGENAREKTDEVSESDRLTSPSATAHAQREHRGGRDDEAAGEAEQEPERPALDRAGSHGLDGDVAEPRPVRDSCKSGRRCCHATLARVPYLSPSTTAWIVFTIAAIRIANMTSTNVRLAPSYHQGSSNWNGNTR